MIGTMEDETDEPEAEGDQNLVKDPFHILASIVRGEGAMEFIYRTNARDEILDEEDEDKKGKGKGRGRGRGRRRSEGQ
jgi:hypothetical protein